MERSSSALQKTKKKYEELNNQHSNLITLHSSLEVQHVTLETQHADLGATHSNLETLHANLEVQFEDLKNKYKSLQKYFFGKRSEKLTPVDELQGSLFNEAESSEMVLGENNESEKIKSEEMNSDDVTVVKQYSRSKAGRKPISADIPRKEIIHDLSDEEKACECCSKCRPLIGTKITEELELKPAEIFVLKHVYPTYGPCSCDGSINEEKPEVISAPVPKRMIPGSIASESLIAYIITSKFCDAIPFYRQSKMFSRIDIDISRATMCNWQMTAFEGMDLFFEVMKETVKSGEFIRMDETTVQVLHEEDRDPESKSYMWVAIGYPARGRQLVLYEYHPTRAGRIPMEFLKGFKGYLQTDGYAAYNAPVTEYGLVHVGCFAHARREFHKAYDPKAKKSSAYKALMIIKKIYEIESDLRGKDLSDKDFLKKRRTAVTPVLDELHKFLVETKELVTPSSLVGEAVTYTLNQWDKLIRYLDLACMTPDNNEIERSIKSFVIGRKNWMFSNTSRGANASAGMYSLIESAKANRLDPYQYLRFLFTKLPYVRDDKDELRKLLPCFLSPEDIKIPD
jgi:transposase